MNEFFHENIPVYAIICNYTLVHILMIFFKLEAFFCTDAPVVSLKKDQYCGAQFCRRVPYWGPDIP